MSKLKENKKQKREALLTTAFNLFTNKGVNETSISDIVNNAGVAKGTFYLYFRDKYDIRNMLISHKATQLFLKANEAMEKTDIMEFEEQILFLADNIIDQLNTNKSLLNFISKNLSWGIFRTILSSPKEQDDINFYDVYLEMLNSSKKNYRDPELMIYMIAELISSSCYSVILYGEPVTLEQLKPDLYKIIRHILHEYEDGTNKNSI